MHSRNTTATVVTLPSLRSTLQKYGLQHLLDDTQSSSLTPSPNLFQKPILSVSTCTLQFQAAPADHQVQAAPAVHQVSAKPYKQQRALGATGVYEIYKKHDPVLVATTKSKMVQCVAPGCFRVSRKQKLCFIHGSRKSCKFKNCLKCPIKGGLCSSHGGGTRCTTSSCSSFVVLGDKCYAHGAALRCSTQKCMNACRIDGFCRKHYNALNPQK